MNRLVSLWYFAVIYPYYKIVLGRLGFKSRIISPLKLDGKKKIFIDDNVVVQYKTWLAAVPLTNMEQCYLKIGEGSRIGNFCHIYATSTIQIEKFVLIADKVYISDNLHGYADINIPINGQPIKQLNPVIIGEGAWLGENVCVIGASIGKQSVIGAGSVVTKNIPNFCVAVGSPAKIIKRYSFDKKEWLRTDSEGNFI